MQGIFRKTLKANEKEEYKFGTNFYALKIMNLSDSDGFYLNIGLDVEVEDEDVLFVPADCIVELKRRGSSISVISEGTPKVQVIATKY